MKHAHIHSSILAIAMILSACSAQQSPKEAARMFLQQVSAGQMQQAYDAMSQVFKKSANFEEFTRVVAQYSVLQGVDEIDLTEPTIEGQTATVSGTIKSADGQTIPLMLQLNSEEGTWRVMGLDISVPTTQE